MGLLKIGAFGVGSVAAAWIAWKLLAIVLAISFLVVKIAIIGAMVMGAIWLFKRLMRDPVRSTDTAS
jgi:hypothetical protein